MPLVCVVNENPNNVSHRHAVVSEMINSVFLPGFLIFSLTYCLNAAIVTPFPLLWHSVRIQLVTSSLIETSSTNHNNPVDSLGLLARTKPSAMY